MKILLKNKIEIQKSLESPMGDSISATNEKQIQKSIDCTMVQKIPKRQLRPLSKTTKAEAFL